MACRNSNRSVLLALSMTRGAGSVVDPEGGGQDDRRFSIGQGCPVEKLRRW